MFNYCRFNLHSASLVRSDAMSFRSLFHIITTWCLLESVPCDLMFTSSTNTMFPKAERVE